MEEVKSRWYHNGIYAVKTGAMIERYSEWAIRAELFRATVAEECLSRVRFA